MMSLSNAAFAARSRILAAAGVVLWAAVSLACSGAATNGGGLGREEGDQEAGASDPTDEAGADSASTDDVPSGPAYSGKPVADPERDASVSIASPDGSCPIPDTLAEYGASCTSCAQSHCASALSECDPTMVNACTEYYCPTQCPQPDSDGGGGNACARVVQCCPTLLGTPLYFQCIGYKATSAQAPCQTLLSQAQAMGRCQ